MRRISTNMQNMDANNNLRSLESRLNAANNRMGSQKRIQLLRDDPLAASHIVRHGSYLKRIENFEKNALALSDKFVLREGYMMSTLDIMQRVRELAVAGANGIYTEDDLKNMAGEVDELLKEMIQNANAISSDGNYVFAGTNTKSLPFDVEFENVEGSGVALVNNVRYNGNIDVNKIEVDEGKYLDVDNSGNRAFWAEKQSLFGGRDASSWKASAESLIKIDGVSIKVNAGDNIHALVAKINSSGAAVKAGVDAITKSLRLETIDARQLWLTDEKGNVLSELGVINTTAEAPYNIGESATVSGGSMFDAVIAFRNALLRGDKESVGGYVLGTLDEGISNLTARLTKSGSDYERALINAKKDSSTILDTNSQLAREGDLDVTKALVDMKILDYTHQATLMNAAKLQQTTLLNFLR